MKKENIELSGGFSVSKYGYECFREIVVASLPEMNPGKAYNLKKILGREIWSQLDHGDRRLMGRCVAHMVTQKALPLSFAESKHEYPKRYQLQ
ncbi:MAG: DUF1413 domain-containing protein [Nitrosomonas sp.]|uniref:DUF1413 domain-containing protein n=1 Tax=Nitrosomonas sp. TaxID=42353 RepID=UPI0027504FF5|nr:DUF1413 domain-containing protein [Nitrosomonas sp.]MDP3609444.1 DUF1413 domain-containing protein [Methylophilus sp.]MDZ4107346.1 DUF1413 domain-containing protein [Nitrosomonas sp.]